MPVFSTPEPIAVNLELAAGEVRLVAGDRVDTVVDVRPTKASAEADVRAAAETRVELAAGGLQVRAPRQRGPGLFGRVGSVVVTIELPTGSQVRGVAAMGSVRAVGRLGDCRIKTGMGDIDLDGTGSLDLDTGHGSIDVKRVAGDVDARTGHGNIRLGRVEGGAVVKSANGDCRLGAVGGNLHARSANGDISIDSAGAETTAATANGDLRVGSAGGSTKLETACGRIDIGIPAGTAARLDVRTGGGRVDNLLDPVDGPAPSDLTVEVRARTAYGDIVVRRAPQGSDTAGGESAHSLRK
jgi:DUF4097 and DUF4098 domain-containing protein YvlB